MASKSPQDIGRAKKGGDGSKSQSKKRKMTPEEQSARFIETARELECDENEVGFEKSLSTIVLKVYKK